MVEFVVVGGGISGVTVFEELLRVLIEAHDDATTRVKHRQTAAELAANTARLTLLHPAECVLRVAAYERHTDQLEEVTDIGAMSGEHWMAEMRARIPEGAPLQVRLLRGAIAGLDTRNKEVLYNETAEGEAQQPAPSSSSTRRVRYDKLCLCTGARPSLFVTPPPGTALPPQVLSIRDAASLARLSAMLAVPAPCGRSKRLAIVGNGGIALELVHALHTSQLHTINVSDAVATHSDATSADSSNTAPSAAATPSSRSALPAPLPLPPLSVSWIVPHAFMGSTFLDPMASAFLMPELFAEDDPTLPPAAAANPADAASATVAAGGGSVAPATIEDAEERIVSIPHGHHVKTVLRGARATPGSSDAAASSAAVAGQSNPATAASTGVALGPMWLNQLFIDTNIPKYVMERERAAKVKAAAAATTAAAAGDAMSDSSDAPATAAAPSSSFDLSLELCAEVAELCVHDDSSDASPSSSFPLSLRLTTGKIVDCDFVVSATGVRPNTEWAPAEVHAQMLTAFEQSLTLADDGGIQIDESMHSSVPDVFAAGDCSSLRFSLDFQSQHSELHPCLFHPARLWGHAKLLGLYAARAMSGQYDEELSELGGFNFLLFAHTTTLLGKKVILLGRFNLQGFSPDDVRRLKAQKALRTLVRCKPDRREELIKLHLLHGRIIGATIIGDAGSETVDLEETFENLMLNQTNMNEYGDFLNDVQVDLADYFD